MLDTAQDDVTHVSSCLRRFSLFWVSVLGSVSELMTWKHPYRTKTHKSQSSSPTVMHNHRAIYPFYIDYHTVLWNTWFWLVYWWFVGDFSLSPLKKKEVALATRGKRGHSLSCGDESVQVSVVLVQDLSSTSLSSGLQANHDALFEMTRREGGATFSTISETLNTAFPQWR